MDGWINKSPLFAWYFPEYKSPYPISFTILKKKKNKKTSRSELFQGFKRSDALNG